jgi:hypothetical protein
MKEVIMGAWGNGSFDNDAAMDFVSDLINFKSLRKLVFKKSFSDFDYHEVRVSAEILLHLHKINTLWTDQEVIDKLIERLETIAADDEWFTTWIDERDGRNIRRTIKRFIKGLKEIEGY